MLKLSVVVVVVTLTIVRADSSDNSICWKTEADNQVPAGREGNILLHVCRKHINGEAIPGKLFKWPNTNMGVTCNLAYKGQYRWEKPPYELLTEPPGTTSWIPYNGSVTLNNVLGGQLNQFRIYVCRGIVGNSLLPGYLVPEDGTCYVEIGGREHRVQHDFEVLVRNKFGELLGTNLCT